MFGRWRSVERNDIGLDSDAMRMFHLSNPRSPCRSCPDHYARAASILASIAFQQPLLLMISQTPPVSRKSRYMSPWSLHQGIYTGHSRNQGSLSSTPHSPNSNSTNHKTTLHNAVLYPPLRRRATRFQRSPGRTHPSVSLLIGRVSRVIADSADEVNSALYSILLSRVSSPPLLVSDSQS